MFIGKKSPEACEDGMVVTDDFIAVIDGFMGFGNAGALLDTIIRTEKNRNLNIISSLSADPNEREPNCLFRHSS